MYKNFLEFFYSYEALDHEVQCVVVGIGVDLSSVLVSEKCAHAFLDSLTLQRLHLGLAVLWALFWWQTSTLVSPSFTKFFIFSGIGGVSFKLLVCEGTALFSLCQIYIYIG